MEALTAPLTETIKRVSQIIASRNTELLYEPSLSPSEQYFTSEREAMGINCNKCSNTGFILSERDGFDVARECSCMALYKNKLRLKKSGLANVFNRYTFEEYMSENEWQRVIKQSAENFVRDFAGKWFFLGGQVGSGKTHLCTAICGELIKQMPVYYMPWRDDIVSIKANVLNDEYYQKSISMLKNIQLLYIDDFFKGKVTEADISIAFEVLNYRYNNKLCTLISSEHRIDNLLAIDSAIGSRIHEMAKGNCNAVSPSEDRNYRMKGGL